MSTNHKIHQLIDWYVEMGIVTAVGPTPTNHFNFVPLPATPLARPSHNNRDSWKDRDSQPTAPLSQSLMPKNAPVSLSEPPPPQTRALSKMSQDSWSIVQACQTLEDLRKTVQNYEGCALKFTATHCVFCDGNPDADIMIIGEAPGADEDREGLPFVGVSGQLLNRALATIGLNRTNVYITNIIPWRPPGNRPPTPQEIAQCLPFVERHIELVHPKLLILVGSVAAKAVLKQVDGITKIRGRWFEYQPPHPDAPIRTIATFHPAFLLRSPNQKAQLWQDLLKIEEEIRKWERLGTK